MARYFDSKGKAIQIGARLGAGGEGTVHEAVGRQGIVAKLYHQPLSAERAQKVIAMTYMASSALRATTAWPIDLVLTDSRTAIGLLMPKLENAKDVHKLYSPKSRKSEFQQADFRFLVHTSGNIARAFANVHDAGCVIGDVNHGSILVSGDGTVRLIDCDSFQIETNGRTFLCEVGVPTFTPPELQGRPFRGIKRRANHDNFGLAVVIFLMLFMGRHPFAGRYSGRGDMPIETAIQEFRFAYSADRTRTLMQPPPFTPDMNSVAAGLVPLFERAFGSAGVVSRPTAAEWISALDVLGKALVTCRAEASHAHLSGVAACPWCQIEAATGVSMFPLVFQQTTRVVQFDLVAAWRAIDAIRLAPFERTPTMADIGAVSPTSSAREARGTERRRVHLTMLGRTSAVAVLCALTAVAPNFFILWVGLVWIAYGVASNSYPPSSLSAFKSATRLAETKYERARDEYEALKATAAGSEAPFGRMRMELQRARDGWNALAGKRATELSRLEAERERQQRHEYLERFYIDRATISGIGPGRKATLASFGIETAADIEQSKVRNVQGFGDAMTKKLMDWRRQLERSFRFDPTKGVDPALIAAMDKKLRDERKKYEHELMQGPMRLMEVRRQTEQRSTLLRRNVEEALSALAQAKADEAEARR